MNLEYKDFCDDEVCSKLNHSKFDFMALLAWIFTGLRIPLLCLFFYFVVTLPHSLFPMLTIFAIIIFDVLDGEIYDLSRCATSQVKRANRHMFDAIVDRIIIFSVITIVSYHYGLSISILFLILIRELALFLIVAYPLLKKKKF